MGRPKPNAALRDVRFKTFNEFVDEAMRPLTDGKEYSVIITWIYLFRKVDYNTGMIRGVSARSVAKATGLDKNTAGKAIKRLIDLGALSVAEAASNVRQTPVYKVRHYGQDVYEPVIHE